MFEKLQKIKFYYHDIFICVKWKKYAIIRESFNDANVWLYDDNEIYINFSIWVHVNIFFYVQILSL